MLVSQNERIPDEQFTGEWENRFFLRNGREVKLRCRLHKSEQETYLSAADWGYKLDDQDRAFLLRAGIPQRFYRVEPVCRTTLATPVPRTPTTTAAPSNTASKPRTAAPRKRNKPGAGRSFPWDSPVAEFVVYEMDGRPEFRVETTSCGVKVFATKDNRRLSKQQVLDFREQLERRLVAV